jgi:two-component system, LuxR family, sensor kinase FixL
MEYRLRRDDGVLDNGVPRYTPEDGFAGYIGSCIDITPRRQAELEAARQRNELAHLSRVSLLGELSGSFAHELNQPLTAILSNAQAAQRFLAQEASDPAELQEILNDIVEEDKRAGEVIRGMHLLLKKGEVQLQALDANEVVQNVLKLLHSDLVNQNVAVHVELALHLPPVNGDGVQLQQVLLNLVVNGCDAMADIKAVDRRLLVRTELADGKDVLVSVADQGYGVPPEKIDRIFEPFSLPRRGDGDGPRCLPHDHLRSRRQALGNEQPETRCDLSVRATHKRKRHRMSVQAAINFVVNDEPSVLKAE